MTALSSQRQAAKRRLTRAKDAFASEAELCLTFATAMRAKGWTVYPETAGFDLLLANADGEQVGVQAKLALNVKVCDQILAGAAHDAAGPDFRAVLVPGLGVQNRVLAGMLQTSRVIVFAPVAKRVSREGKPVTAWTFESLPAEDWPRWHAGQPAQRLALPKFSAADMERMPAGTPSPVRLTAFKERVLLLLARLRVRGFVYARDVIDLGLHRDSFCDDAGPSFLRPSPHEREPAERGRKWILNPDGGLPRFDLQFPHTFAELVAVESRGRPIEAGPSLALPAGIVPMDEPEPAPALPQPPPQLEPEANHVNNNEHSDIDTINDLRSELFATMRSLRDSANPMDVNRAKAVADVAGRIIDSVKAETDYMKTFGGRGVVPASGFISSAPKPDTLDRQARIVGPVPDAPKPGSGLPPAGPRASL